MDKQALRRRMIESRQALAPDERAGRSRLAQEALLAADEWDRAGTVLIYLPVRGEVDTGLLCEDALRRGKRVLAPRVERAARRLWLHEWDGSPADLVPGAYGIPEPRPGLPLVRPDQVDLVVVPGVAFDRQGNRLGYGGGYYDRALPGMRQAARVGLAYGLQLVDRLPTEPHDVRLDALATEEGLLRFS